MKIESEDILIEEKSGHFQAKSGFGNHPVIEVSWYGARAYCIWLSELSGEDYRLPTEAEWEYAAGGGPSNRTKYAGTNNDNTDSLGFYMNAIFPGSRDTFALTAPVKTFKSNCLELYDMSGNVNEWCIDYYDENYYQYCLDKRIVHNPKNIKKGDLTVCRGGNHSSFFWELQVTHRDFRRPEYGGYNVGFRLAKTLP